MTSTPTWLGKRAPTGLKTYDAWSADPTRDYLDTPFHREEPKSYAGIVLLMLASVAIAVWIAALWIGVTR